MIFLVCFLYVFFVGPIAAMNIGDLDISYPGQIMDHGSLQSTVLIADCLREETIRLLDHQMDYKDLNVRLTNQTLY